VALRAFATGAQAVYLARADTFPDALAAGSLTDGPVLLVPPSGTVPDVVTSTVTALAPARVVALGGTAAVSDGVLSAAAAGRATSRLAGADRYTTAVEISKAAFATTVPANVYLARGDDFPDALAAGVVTDGPVLLVPATGPVPEAVLAEVRRLKPSRVVALGGTGVVSDALLAAAAGGAPTGRLAGETRYDTAVAISAAAFPRGAAVVYLARGDAFPDALAAGALTDGPILLVPTCGALPAPVLAEVARLTPGTVVALGGPTAVCDQLLTSATTGGTASEATYLSEQQPLSSPPYLYTEPASISGVVHARTLRFDLAGGTAAAE
jgi:putative cell wall-binding protein